MEQRPEEERTAPQEETTPQDETVPQEETVSQEEAVSKGEPILAEDAVPAENAILTEAEKKPTRKRLFIIGGAILAALVVLAAVVWAVLPEPRITQTYAGISCDIPKSWALQETQEDALCFVWSDKQEVKGYFWMFYLDTGLSWETSEFEVLIGDMLCSIGDAQFDHAQYYCEDYGNGQAMLELQVREEFYDDAKKQMQTIADSIQLDEETEQQLFEDCAAKYEEAMQPLQEITLYSASDLNSAQTVYDSFSPKVQAYLADRAGALEDAWAEYDEIESQTAKDIENKLNAVGEITLEKKEKLAAVEDAWAVLPEEVQHKYSLLGEKLEDASSALQKLEKEAQDKEKIEAAEAAIAAIGEVTLDSNTALDKAKAAIEAAGEELEERISNLNVYTQARSQYNQLKKAKELEDKKQSLKDNCVSITYDEIARNPSDYIGKEIWFRGEIVQVVDDYHYRVNITEGSYFWEDTIYLTIPYDCLKGYDGKLLEDDIITVYGHGDGEKTYTSILGQKITIPSIWAEYVIR